MSLPSLPSLPGLPSCKDCKLSPAQAVGIFVILETNKDPIFKRLWIVGVVACLYSVAITGVLLVGASTVVYLLSAVGTAVCGFFGWWASLNKKDDLNMMHQVAKLGEHLDRMKAAELKLESALESMLLSGADIDKIDDEINAEQDATEGTIVSIRRLNGAGRFKFLRCTPAWRA